MTFIEELSRAGLPYGIRKDLSVFVMAGHRMLEVNDLMPVDEIVLSHRELIAGREAMWERLGNWASQAATEFQERKRAEA